MRNWWLAAIAGHQGNVPSDIPEGPAGAEGAGEIGRPGCGTGEIGRPGCGTGEIGRPGCGARGLRHSWAVGPDNEPKRRAKLAARTARGRAAAHGAAQPRGRARRPENPRVHKQQPAPHSNT